MNTATNAKPAGRAAGVSWDWSSLSTSGSYDDSETERALIHLLIVRPHLIGSCSLKPEDFGTLRERIGFIKLLSLFRRGSAVGFRELRDEMLRDGINLADAHAVIAGLVAPSNCDPDPAVRLAAWEAAIRAKGEAAKGITWPMMRRRLTAESHGATEDATRARRMLFEMDRPFVPEAVHRVAEAFAFNLTALVYDIDPRKRGEAARALAAVIALATPSDLWRAA